MLLTLTLSASTNQLKTIVTEVCRVWQHLITEAAESFDYGLPGICKDALVQLYRALNHTPIAKAKEIDESR